MKKKTVKPSEKWKKESSEDEEFCEQKKDESNGEESSGLFDEKGLEKITAKVPLKEMYKYSTSLSSITGGRGLFSMEFAEYEKVPADVQDELLKAYAEEAEEE